MTEKSRCFLHKGKLAAFKEWLDDNLVAYRDGKGPFQVLQVLTNENGWQVIYDRIDATEHYTVQGKLMPLVKQFVRESKRT